MTDHAQDAVSSELEQSPTPDQTEPVAPDTPAESADQAAAEDVAAEEAAAEETAPQADSAAADDKAARKAAKKAEKAARKAAEHPAAPTTDQEHPSFGSLGLPHHLLRAVEELGFTAPTPVQARTIPVLLSGRDVVGVAQTGTGKTAAFGLPLLAEVDPRAKEAQAVVLAPTRELAIQVADAIADLAHRMPGLQVLPIYGGSSYIPQLRGLKDGAQVVVGTPGRVIDHIERGSLDLTNVRFLVLDEADEMLRMGFAEEVESIAEHVPTERRTALFSATMPGPIRRVAATHMTDPVHVSVTPAATTVAAIEQTYAVVPFRHKTGALARILAVSDADAAIVFVRTKAQVEEVAIELQGRGVQAAALSGDVPQKERERLVERLREGTLDVLVATDVAARGLDVDRVGLVVNYDVPRETDSYVHRIGRTGRAGRQGRALTFLTPRERGRLGQIERATGATLTEAVIPTPADVSAHRARGILMSVSERHDAGRLDLYRRLLTEALGVSTPADPAEVAATLLALAVGDTGPRRRDEEPEQLALPARAPRERTWKDDRPGASGDRRRPRREEHLDEDGEFVSARFEEGREQRPRPGRRPHAGAGTTYRVDVGHRDGVRPAAIVGALTGESALRGGDIGKIDIFPSFSLVEITGDLDPRSLDKLGRAVIGGRRLNMREDTGPRGGGRPGRPQRAGDARGRGDRGPGGWRKDGERFERRSPSRPRY